MTPDDREQLRVAVAEAVGWTFEHKNKGSSHYAECIVIRKGDREGGGYFVGDPACRVTEALDAAGIPALTLDWLAECRKTLTEEERHAYAVLLALKFSPHGWNDWRDTWSVIDAPVETHAIVLLKAKGITHPTENRI